MTPLSSHPDTSAAQGLSSCNECGLCCRLNPCLLEPGDAQRIAAALEMPLKRFVQRLQVEKTPRGQTLVRMRRPCAFLDGNQCSIQEHKPKGGADFECWTPSTYRKTYFWPRAALRDLVRATT